MGVPQAEAQAGIRFSVVTELMMRLLGLDYVADTLARAPPSWPLPPRPPLCFAFPLGAGQLPDSLHPCYRPSSEGRSLRVHGRVPARR